MDTNNDRIERLLVLLLLESMNDRPQKDKVVKLNIAGFSNIEIAEFIQTSPQVVATLIYESKKFPKPKKRN